MSMPPFDPKLFDPEPSAQEKALLDLFVTEYMKDFHEYDACIRVGFQAVYALEYSKVFLNKTYVQRAIAERKREAVATNQSEIESDTTLIKATLREAMHKGPFQSRAVAAKTLAGIHGIDQAPDRSAEEAVKLVQLFKDIAKELPS